jgi:glycogen synthase
VWSRAARIVAVSRNLRNLAYATSPEAVIDVIPNGVDVDFFTPGPAQAGGVLFVGRLIERKGVHLLIEAVAGLAAGQPEPTLTIVGDGPERQRLEAMARRLGLSDRIAFRGQLGREALAAAYRDAAILVLPAVTDAMPNVVLEAMASGLAIVTTRTGGAELVQGNGVVVDRADPESLRAAIAGYVAAPDLLVTHREASRRLAQGMSWRAVGNYFLDVYGEVMAMSAGRSASIPAREFQLPAG